MQAAGGKRRRLAGSSIPGTCRLACSGMRSGLIQSASVDAIRGFFRAKKTPTSCFSLFKRCFSLITFLSTYLRHYYHHLSNIIIFHSPSSFGHHYLSTIIIFRPSSSFSHHGLLAIIIFTHCNHHQSYILHPQTSYTSSLPRQARLRLSVNNTHHLEACSQRLRIQF